MQNIVRELADGLGEEVVLARRLTERIVQAIASGVDFESILTDPELCDDEIIRDWLALSGTRAILQYGLKHGIVSTDELSINCHTATTNAPLEFMPPVNIAIHRCESSGVFAVYMTCTARKEDRVLWSTLLYRDRKPLRDNVFMQMLGKSLETLHFAGGLSSEQAKAIFASIEDIGDEWLEPFRRPPPSGDESN